MVTRGTKPRLLQQQVKHRQLNLLEVICVSNIFTKIIITTHHRYRQPPTTSVFCKSPSETRFSMTDQRAGPVRLRGNLLEVPALLAVAGSIPRLGFLDPTSRFRFRSTNYAGRVRLRRAGVKAGPAKRGKFPYWAVVFRQCGRVEDGHDALAISANGGTGGA